AGGAAPFLLIPDLLETTEQHVFAEAHHLKQKILLETLADRDSQILKRLKQQKVLQNTISAVEKLLTADRRERKRAERRNVVVLGEKEGVEIDLRHLRLKVLPDVAEQIRLQLAKATELQEKIARIDRKLAAVPPEEAGAALVQKQKQLRQQLQAKQAEL